MAGIIGKIFRNTAKAGEGMTEAMGKAGGTVLKGVGVAAVGSAVGVGTAVAGTAAAGAGFFKGMATRPGAFAKGLLGLAIIGGAFGAIAHQVRKGRRKDRPMPDVDLADMLPPPVDMGMMPQNTMMGMPLVEGPKAQAIREQRAAGAPQVGPQVGM